MGPIKRGRFGKYYRKRAKHANIIAQTFNPKGPEIPSSPLLLGSDDSGAKAKLPPLAIKSFADFTITSSPHATFPLRHVVYEGRLFQASVFLISELYSH